MTLTFEIVALTSEDPRYHKIFDRITGDPLLRQQAWEHAESRIAQHLPGEDLLTGEPGWPSRCWWLALADDGEPMAWCAAQLTWRQVDGATVPLVLARDSFHVPKFYDVDVYPAVFAAREDSIRHLPGVTYIFGDHMSLHLDAGWEVFDSGQSDEPDAGPHLWWGLKRGW